MTILLLYIDRLFIKKKAMYSWRSGRILHGIVVFINIIVKLNILAARHI